MKNPYNPFAPLTCAWYRSLIARLAKREIDVRYRGSVLGVIWAFVVPMLMLGVYTFFCGLPDSVGDANGGKGRLCAVIVFRVDYF